MPPIVIKSRRRGPGMSLDAALAGGRAPQPGREVGSGNNLTLRRWEGAETHRLNQAHWQTAHGRPINQDLIERLETLRTRSAYEASNNELIEGMVETHISDMLGEHGPTLQVQSDSNRYNQALEHEWESWTASCDYAGERCLLDFLELWVRDLWTCGEYFVQKSTNILAETPVKLRLRGIHPRRVASPFDRTKPDIILGVERDRDGRVIAYYVYEDDNLEAFAGPTLKWERLPAKDVIHDFNRLEEGQVRGAPWLASALNTIADLRDYDSDVGAAARAAANHAVYFWTNHPELEPAVARGTAEIERGTAAFLPPGYQIGETHPSQPAARYVDYRKERHGDIGRARSIPLMMVRLDASNHNYSSARFDGQVYLRQLKRERGKRARRLLNPLVADVARELELGNRLPARPARVRYTWVWPALPHIDPQKERNAERTGLQNLTLTFPEACAAGSTDEESVFASWQRTLALAEKYGVRPILEAMLAGAQAVTTDQDDEDDVDESDDTSTDDIDDEPAGRRNGRLLHAT